MGGASFIPLPQTRTSQMLSEMTIWSYSILLFFFILLAFHVCPCSCTSHDSFIMMTYNTHLIRTRTLHYSARKEELQSVLAKSSADVVCLQEVWLQQDIMDIVYAARSQFPHYHSFNSTGQPGQQVPISTPPCQEATFKAYLTCTNAKCSQFMPSGLIAVTACGTVACSSQFLALSQTCINCQIFLDTTAVNSTNLMDSLLKGCVEAPTVNYATTHGLLLLSRYPLTNKTVHAFYSNYILLITRGYVAAEIDHLGSVVCTDLSTTLPLYLGPPSFTTYQEMNNYETDKLLQDFPANRKDSSPVLMGDFNHGPASTGVEAVFLTNYQKVIEEGFVSPYVSEVGKCTKCSENPLAGNSTIPKIVDHIYVKQGTTVSNVERIFNNNAAVNISQGLFPISDHYGVQLIILMTTLTNDKDEITERPTNESCLDPEISFIGDMSVIDATRRDTVSGVFHSNCLELVNRSSQLSVFHNGYKLQNPSVSVKFVRLPQRIRIKDAVEITFTIKNLRKGHAGEYTLQYSNSSDSFILNVQDLRLLNSTFDDGMSNWKSKSRPANSTIGWWRHSGSIALHTGPQTGHGGSGYYIYVQASKLDDGHEALLKSLVMRSSSLPITLTFAYYMHGSSVGSLRVVQTLYTAGNGGTHRGVEKWSRRGDQRDMWHTAIMPIGPITGYRKSRITFLATVGQNGYIALDSIMFLP